MKTIPLRVFYERALIWSGRAWSIRGKDLTLAAHATGLVEGMCVEVVTADEKHRVGIVRCVDRQRARIGLT